MRNAVKILSNSSGQALMIALGLGLLLLVGLGAVFFMNQMGSFHQTASTRRSAAGPVAEQGLAYAMQELFRSSSTWKNALNGNFAGTDCNSATVLNSPSGGHFKFYCSTGTAGNPNLQPYQVAVTAVASVTAGNGAEMPLRAVQAYMSPRMLGADLASGIHAAAALEMVAQPSVAGSLDVQWGPIVCLDSNDPDTNNPLNAWTLVNPLDAGQYPRKFSVGYITGGVNPRSVIGGTMGPLSDQKEYWAHASQTDVPLVDESYYQMIASSTDLTVLPTSANGIAFNITNHPCPGAHPNCGWFVPTPGDTLIFDGAAPGFSLSGGVEGAAVYVDGSAQFKKVAIDSAAFVVTGQLTISDGSGGNTLTLQVPMTAPSEYPYGTAWPCQGSQGTTCNSPGLVQFRGFLYVKGNLVVGANWTMAGALWVGDLGAVPGTSGTLQIPAGDSMTVFYDAGINHTVHVNPLSGTSLKGETDSFKDVPAF